MSLLRIPVLAENILPYQQDAQYLTLVHNSDDWYNKIIEVKEKYSTYKELANKAHDYVLQEYNIKNYYLEWIKTIERLCK